MIHSLRTRLIASLVVILVIVGGVVGLSVSTLFAHVLRAEYAQSYQSNARTAAITLQSKLGGGLFLQPSVTIHGLAPALRTLSADLGVRIRLYRATPSTTLLVADSGPEHPPAHTHLAIDDFAPVQTNLSPTGSGPRLALVVVSDPLTDRAVVQQSFVQTMVWILLGASLLAVVLVSMLADRLTGPLRLLARATAQVDVGHFTEQVPETQRDEVGEVARQFNRMSRRLAESFASIAAERDQLALERDRLTVDRDRLRDFVAEVSHELRTPLTALHTFNDLLQDGAGADPTTRQEFLAESAQQIDRLTWLTRNLLDLSRLDAGITRITPQRADVAKTIAGVIETNWPAATAKGVTLRYEGTSVDVPHDPPRLEQAVSNIISNAIKFSPRGGSVRIRIIATAQQAIAEVSDDGPGIAATDVPHIFERFYRGHEANRAGDGSGLGLAITKAIVEAHGGTITVDTACGRGTTLRVALPRTAVVEASSAANGRG